MFKGKTNPMLMAGKQHFHKEGSFLLANCITFDFVIYCEPFNNQEKVKKCTYYPGEQCNDGEWLI